MIPEDLSGTGMHNNYHFKGTDSISSLGSLQEVEIFDHESGILDDIMAIEMKEENILAN